MWHGKSLAVILPTYNEKDSIADTIRGFEELRLVDEILVVNNNATPGTSEAVSKTTAREVFEAKQGYGAAIRRGFREINTDLICVCEPDGTFNARDLLKLLPFTTECDFVIGSRTVSSFIWEGANMGRFLRWGNCWSPNSSRSFSYGLPERRGCTFRVVRKECLNDISQSSPPRVRRSGCKCYLLLSFDVIAQFSCQSIITRG
jgi:glycosyltransferase involved in cell wall biosynthesis